MDTSDGFAPTPEELAIVNQMIDLAALRSHSHRFADVVARPERPWFGWGDWTVVATVSDNMIPKVAHILSDSHHAWSDVGRILRGQPNVCLVDGDARMRAERLESERFAEDSWFVKGIGEYIRQLSTYPLP
jgi:hypothetical protein